MVKNDRGDVALVYYQTIPQHVRVNKHDYIFTVRRNICLAWVKESDVDAILAITKKCGCGSGPKRGVYRYASEQEERIWSGRAER